MTHNASPCFCCSNLPFSECCEPVLQDQTKAHTPEMLMRSRYSAFVLQNEDHLLATWAPSTRPDSLSIAENNVHWLDLTVHSASAVSDDDTRGEVHFSARYLEDDNLCTLSEKSRFIRDKSLWYYLDGDTEYSQVKIGRNSPCPCGSGNKYKRCCLNR